MTTSVSSGTYYLEIDGVGYLDGATGWTDYGSIGAYVITGTVLGSSGSGGGGNQTPNQPPTAKIAAIPTSGTVPLAVSFSATGSSDPEGSALSYVWNFGDGTVSTLQNISKTYSSPGTYTASVTVTDSAGLSNTASVTITANPQTVQTPISANIVLTKVDQKKQKYAVATLTVLDTNGNPVSGATVSINWTGLYVGTSSAITRSDGKVEIRSNSIPSRKAIGGSLTAVIANVVPPSASTLNYVWDNVPRSATVTF
jgi:PKD repeat protein